VLALWQALNVQLLYTHLPQSTRKQAHDSLTFVSILCPSVRKVHTLILTSKGGTYAHMKGRARLYCDKEGSDACIDEEGMNNHINEKMTEVHINEEWTAAHISNIDKELTNARIVEEGTHTHINENEEGMDAQFFVSIRK
jgi:hypothetical protein